MSTPDTKLIERLARQSGAVFYGPCSWADPMEVRFDRAGIERFVALIAEECAKVCGPWNPESDWTEYARVCAERSAAIRAKFGAKP